MSTKDLFQVNYSCGHLMKDWVIISVFIDIFHICTYLSESINKISVFEYFNLNI